MKYFILLIAIFISQSCFAQWHEVALFTDSGSHEPERVTVIYFLPNSPQIGYAGTDEELWKTTDGGKTWKVSCSSEELDYQAIQDICFKDSLTGWFSCNGSGGYVYRTEDGGKSWSLLFGTVSDIIAQSIYYDSGTNTLLFSKGLDLYVSSNLGDTWTIENQYAFSFSFLTDSIGIAGTAFGSNPEIGNYTDTMCGFLCTTDGGLTWNLSNFEMDFDTGEAWPFGYPLAIKGTSTAFAATEREIEIFRSDDYGENWRKIYDFGPPWDSDFNTTGPYGTGDIEGNLSRLTIQTDTGMYVSTDEGVTWNFDGGPPTTNSGYGHHFYSANGVTFADLDTGGQSFGGALWEEIWPQSSVSEDTLGILSNASAYPNPTGSGTVISFGVSQEAYVKIEVFSVLGNLVSSAGFESLFEPGNKAVPISLAGLPSGTYFARIQTAYGEAQTVKIVKQ